MRITGGELRGRKLALLKGDLIRPTSDKVREAIFNLLDQDVRGLTVLDLFAGTGILGIEALSRGARRVLFVDHSHQAVQLIRRNLTLCGYQGAGRVFRADLTKGLPTECHLMKGDIDLVFADPPYRRGFLPPLLEDLLSRNILASPSRVVAEISRKDEVPTNLADLELIKTRIYGDTKVCIFLHNGRER